MTEKASPEHELVVTSAVAAEGAGEVANKIIYEQRVGSSTQIELMVPFSSVKRTDGTWSTGIRDVAMGAKQVIFHSLRSGTIASIGYLKDNRLLPRGFDKASAPAEVAVQGEARLDPDFTAAGDRVRFRVEQGMATGPFKIEAELLYQPIAYRWAHNLAEVGAPEPNRFVGLFASAARTSTTRIAPATDSTP